MGIRVLIVDDHEVIRTGISALVAGTEIEVVGMASSCAAALETAHATRPDVVLLDVRMPDGDGFATLARLKRELPSTAVVMLTTYDNPTYVNQAASQGASGYVLKGCSRQELLSTVRAVAGGQNVWTDEDLRKAKQVQTTATDPAIDLETPLTKREVEVLCQVANGSGNKEIARTLHISVETVKEHVHNILGKLGASGRTQAAVWAVRQGIA
jgi:DNA-binding NarL/FixJ family response regulator